MGSRKIWKDDELETLRLRYSDTPTKILACTLGRSESSVYGKAAGLGLCKSKSYLAGPEACRLRCGDNVGEATRFRPGHVPANKGLRRPGWSAGRMAETQFKPGHRPHTWKPVGSTRLSKEGYLQRKISETGYPPKDWVGVHILVWQEEHGPVPPGHAVVFKDRNKANISPENLELIPRSELMRRNTIHNHPPELTGVIRLNARLKRQLRSLDEKHTERSAQSSV